MSLKRWREFFAQCFVAGLLFVAPAYIATLLLLKAMKSLATVVRPLARLLPPSLPAETVFSFLLVLIVCLLVGLVLRTPLGGMARKKIENVLRQKVPGYEVIQSMTRQLTGQGQENAFQPALAEIEEALVPAFIVEELSDGRFTVFVPSVPTPFVGSIYILGAERVHRLNVPFTQVLKAITRWGAGSEELVAAVNGPTVPPSPRVVSKPTRIAGSF